MYIGVDIGGTNLVAGVLNERMEVVAKFKRPTAIDRGARGVIDDVSEMCFKAADAADVKPEDIEWIGIGSPGAVDAANGIILFAGNIPYNNSHVAEWVGERWKCPVYVENDANAAALGEAYAGAAKDCDSALLVTLGTGIGGGIILNKRVYSGFNGTGGEIGHMVIEADGWHCTCGHDGCWEAYSSATGLIRMTREAMPEVEHADGMTAFKAARAGDNRGQAVVDKYIKYLSIGLANMINIFQPEMICIGGGVCNEGDALLLPLIEQTRARQFKGSPRLTEIRAAALGNDAGVIGAAMLGKQQK
ncbi:glucokinase [Clostridia bacterium]|nr:glucokinase [Clostridia bacterium]